MTRLAASEVGCWRLVAQRVVPPLVSATDVVERLAAVQAQDLRAAATAVAVRTEAGTTDALVAALESGQVVRSWPLRGTLHLVHAADLHWVLDLCAGRVVAATARRRRELAITDVDVAACRDVAQEFLAGGGRAGRAELLAQFQRAGQATAGGRGYHLLVHLSLTGVLCQGPATGREQTFVLADDWVRVRRAPADPVAEWARRYLRGHGPAAPADFAFWSGLTLSTARRGFDAVRAEFESVLVDDVEHLVDPEVPTLVTSHRRAVRDVHLLPGFDEFLLGYADRSHVLPREHAEAVTPGGNGVFRGTVVAAGNVVGTWTRAGADITPVAFAAFSATRAAAIARRARRLPSGRLG